MTLRMTALTGALAASATAIAMLHAPVSVQADEAEYGITCEEILLGIENRYNGYDSWRIMNMTITSIDGDVRTRRVMAGHLSIGTDRRMRSTVLEPDYLAGTQSMAYDYRRDGLADKVWTYLPAQDEIQEMRSEDLSQRLYGSDLAIGEMLLRQAKDYECEMLGEGEYNGLDVWKIWTNPLTEEEIIRLGLEDGEVWVEKETYLPVHSVFNAAEPNEQRIFDTDDFRWNHGVYVPEYFENSTRKEGRIVSTSVFEVEGERFNSGLPHDWFNIEDLENPDSGWLEFRSWHLDSEAWVRD